MSLRQTSWTGVDGTNMICPMPREHHHVVTKGLQRAFTDADGQLELIDKALTPGRRRVRQVSASNAFVGRNFSSHLANGHYIDDTEDSGQASRAMRYQQSKPGSLARLSQPVGILWEAGRAPR